MTYEEAHINKLSTPISLTNMMVNKPICLVILALLVLGTITFVVLSLGWFLPNDQNSRDFLVWGSTTVNEYDKAALI